MHKFTNYNYLLLHKNWDHCTTLVFSELRKALWFPCRISDFFFCSFVPDVKGRDIMKLLSRESRTWAQIFTFSFFVLLCFLCRYKIFFFFFLMIGISAQYYFCVQRRICISVAVSHHLNWLRDDTCQKQLYVQVTCKCNLEHKKRVVYLSATFLRSNDEWMAKDITLYWF